MVTLGVLIRTVKGGWKSLSPMNIDLWIDRLNKTSSRQKWKTTSWHITQCVLEKQWRAKFSQRWSFELLPNNPVCVELNKLLKAKNYTSQLWLLLLFTIISQYFQFLDNIKLSQAISGGKKKKDGGDFMSRIQEYFIELQGRNETRPKDNSRNRDWNCT